MPDVAGDRGDRLRRVAGEHLHLDALAAQERDRVSARSGAAPPRARRSRAARRSAGGARPRRASAASGRSPRARASTRRPCALALARRLPRGSRAARARARRGRSAPSASATALQRRRLEKGTSPSSALRAPPGRRRRAPRSVRLRADALRRERRRANALSSLARRRARDHLDHPQRGLGERPGLVDADRVHRGQRLDRVELLGEHAATRHPHRRRRVGQADQHIRPSGTSVTTPAVEVATAACRRTWRW